MTLRDCVERLQFLVSVFREIVELVFRIWNDGICTGFPASRAHLTMLVRVLECLDKAKRFVDGPSNWEVVHSDLPQVRLLINYKQASETIRPNLTIILLLKYRTTNDWIFNTMKN